MSAPPQTARCTPQVLAITQGNTAPAITLAHSSSLSLAAGNGLLLTANITDDGVPHPASLTASWSVVQSPPGGNATFDNPAAPSTGVSFSANGTYLLRLTASDGQIQNSTDVTVASGLLNSGSAADVGSVGLAGSSSESAGVWTLKGSGVDIWDSADGFHFRCAELIGDGFIQVRLLGQTNTDLWAKAGLMVRDSLDSDSSHVLLAGTVGNGLALQHRPATGALSQHQPLGAYTYPVWLRLVRTANILRAYTSPDGSSWTQTGSDITPAMTGSVFIGLVITSHNNSALGEATFDNLQGSGFGSTTQAVSAGPDLFATTGVSALLQGSAPGAATVEWQKISGPALSIASPFSLQTTAVPSANGTYSLRLLARGGPATIFDEMLMTSQAASSPMEAWRAARFGSSSAPQAAWNADPDGDGLSNLLEFALGGDPNFADASTIAPRIHSTASGPVFEFRRRRGSGSGGTISGYTLDGVRYHVEVCTSLSAPVWTSGPSSIEEVGGPIDNGDGTETIRVRPVGPPASAFFRIRIE